MNNELIYLDHAAATPISRRVLAAMEPYFYQDFYNPSSPYAPAIEVRKKYNQAKQEIAETIGTKGDDLIITAGATESINLAFNSFGGHIVTTKIEHDAVLSAAQKFEHTLVDVKKDGLVDVDQLEAAIRPDTQIVSLALANSELGTIQSLNKVAEIVARERAKRFEAGNQTPLALHCDASQGIGLLDVKVARLGVDLLTLNSAKIYGPKQMGALWVARQVKLLPQILGGGQENGLRSGTENVAAVVGFAQAMREASRHQKSENQRLKKLRDFLQNSLISAHPTAIISGNLKKQLPNFLHISFPGLDAERLLFMLESRGVLVATGSACAANKGTRSHVLTAIGLPGNVADGSLRLTLGKLNNEENIKAAALIINQVVQAEKDRLAR